MGVRADTDWEALIARHDHVVVLALLARGLRIHEARELAHDAWSRLFEQWTAGRLERMELPGLAIRQALFLASDFQRQRRRANVPWEIAPEVVDPHARPDARLESRQLLRRTELAAAELSPRAQRVFTTVMEIPGTPQAELASRLGLSLQRLRQSLCEVRARLKAAVE
jgi:RNA polymerase sigma factor (sigma-70 family)